MAPRNHYYLAIDDLAHAKGPVPALCFDGVGPDAFAAALQEALRTDALFGRWRALQDDPDDIDPALGVVDPAATVHAGLHGVERVDVDLVTVLPMSVVRHRMNLLIGANWTLRDMRAA